MIKKAQALAESTHGYIYGEKENGGTNRQALIRQRDRNEAPAERQVNAGKKYFDNLIKGLILPNMTQATLFPRKV